MESRRNGPQLSSRHDDDDDVWRSLSRILDNNELVQFRATLIASAFTPDSKCTAEPQ